MKPGRHFGRDQNIWLSIRLGNQNSRLNDFFFKLLSYLPKRHIFSRFGSQSGQYQIRSSHWFWQLGRQSGCDSFSTYLHRPPAQLA